jgi:hypothetical protein
MGSIVESIIKENNDENKLVPPDVIAESRIAEEIAVEIDELKKLNVEASVFACPGCGADYGALKMMYSLDIDVIIGHAYSEKGIETSRTAI